MNAALHFALERNVSFIACIRPAWNKQAYYVYVQYVIERMLKEMIASTLGKIGFRVHFIYFWKKMRDSNS